MLILSFISNIFCERNHKIDRILWKKDYENTAQLRKKQLLTINCRQKLHKIPKFPMTCDEKKTLINTKSNSPGTERHDGEEEQPPEIWSGTWRYSPEVAPGDTPPPELNMGDVGDFPLMLNR